MKPLNKVITNKDTSFNPLWIMRQAGRYLPEFREIRKKNPDFINLCLNDHLSAEITLQPLKRFDIDAAASISNLFNGCRVISADKWSFKHRLIKSGFFFLISLNSGKYRPACLIIHKGLNEVSLFVITLFKGFI